MSKQNFDVKVEVLVPMTITYRVSAETEHEALKMVIDKNNGNRLSTQQHLHKRIKLKATVYRPNSSMVKLTKTYRNIM